MNIDRIFGSKPTSAPDVWRAAVAQVAREMDLDPELVRQLLAADVHFEHDSPSPTAPPACGSGTTTPPATEPMQ